MSDTEKSGRDNQGRFSKGNPGGPGRPRRAVEEDYLAALSDQLSIERWENIVSKAIQDAENGDHKARDWIARYALGPSPKVAEMGLQGALRLFQLAVDEAREKTVEDKIENRLANDRLLESSYDSLLKRY
jgi:hypothetical protein